METGEQPLEETGEGEGGAEGGISHERVQQRAFEIHEREGGTPEENWERAERELREEAGEAPSE